MTWVPHYLNEPLYSTPIKPIIYCKKVNEIETTGKPFHDQFHFVFVEFTFKLFRNFRYKYYYILCEMNTPIWNNWGPSRVGGGGVCAPLIPENNALISPTPWKKVPQLPENIFPWLPKSLKLIQLLPKSPKYKPILPKINPINNGLNRYLWCCIF